MSLWRRKAVELIPSLRAVISSEYVDSPMSLWIELRLAYEKAAAGSPDQAVVLDHVWQYIRWCVAEYRNDDMWQAISVAFFEHLLDTRPVRDDLPERITLKEARTYVPWATYFHSADDVDRYLKWFAGAKRETDRRARQAKHPQQSARANAQR